MLLQAAGNLDRMRQVAQVLARHGFGELLARTGLARLVQRKGDETPTRALPERVRLAMQELGPTFVKLGQILSTRADLLPPDLIAELKKLQEDVPPIPFEAVRAAVEEATGLPLAEVYAAFDEQPLASASIGQVHRARLKRSVVDSDDGKDDDPDLALDVAVKVQRPDIRQTIERDLDLLHLLARLVERTVPESHIYGPVKLAGEFERSITAELDYTVEGQNAVAFRQNFDGNPRVRFPRWFPEVSGRRVHVAEFFDGLKLADAVERGYSGPRIARQAVQVIAQMIFVDGLFHADPHPGNLRVLGTPDEPIIGLLDLGMVGTLPPELRDQTVDLMLAAAQRDADALCDALLAIGRPLEKVDRDAFRAEVVRVSSIHLGKSLKDLQLAALVRDLVQGAIKFHIEMPPELLMVGKALMTVEGIGKSLDPELDVFEEARPFLLRLVWQRFRPDKVGARMLRGATKLSHAAVDLPPLLAEVLDDARRGRLSVRSDNPRLTQAAERLGRRVALGLVSAACVGGATAAQLGSQHGLGVALFVCAGLAALLAWGRVPR